MPHYFLSSVTSVPLWRISLFDPNAAYISLISAIAEYLGPIFFATETQSTQRKLFLFHFFIKYFIAPFVMKTDIFLILIHSIAGYASSNDFSFLCDLCVSVANHFF